MSTVTNIFLPVADLEACAYFATAEALSQGYDLEGERVWFLRHIENCARQWLMKEGADPIIAYTAENTDDAGEILVSAVMRFEGKEVLIASWAIELP